MPIVSSNLHIKYELNTPKTNEVLMFHSGCHGNQVSIATRYETDAYCPKESPYQMWTQSNLRQKSH